MVWFWSVFRSATHSKSLRTSVWPHVDSPCHSLNWSMLSRLVACIFLLVGVQYCAGHHCITASPSPSPSRGPSGPSPSPPPPWYYDRYFYFSNRAPVTETLKKVDGFVDNVDGTLSMLESIEKQILHEQQLRINASQPMKRKRGRSNKFPVRFRSPSIPFCNLEDLEWGDAAGSMFLATFNHTTSIKCVTDFIPKGKNESLLHDLVTNYRRQIDEHAFDINKEAKSMFLGPDTVFNYPYSTKTEDCQFNAIAANRQKGAWYLNVAITNMHKNEPRRFPAQVPSGIRRTTWESCQDDSPREPFRW